MTILKGASLKPMDMGEETTSCQIPAEPCIHPLVGNAARHPQCVCSHGVPASLFRLELVQIYSHAWLTESASPRGDLKPQDGMTLAARNRYTVLLLPL